MLDRQALAALAEADDPVLAAAGQVAMPVKIKRGDRWIIGTIRSLALDPASDAAALTTEIDLMGEGMRGAETGELYGFRRGVTSYPMPGATIHAITNAELAGIHLNRAQATVTIGTVHPARTVPATLAVDALLGRHFAILGSTGTGKSTATAMILHRICERAPLGHIVMIDPHGEYAHAFRDTGTIHDVGNLRMPYWLMISPSIARSCSPPAASSARTTWTCSPNACSPPGCATGPPPSCRVSPSTRRPLSAVRPERAAGPGDEQARPGRRPRALSTDQVPDRGDQGRSRYAFMFSGMLVADTMTDFLARILRMPGDGRPISIIDVSGVPSEVTSAVVAVLARMIFDHAIWTHPAERRPVLMVCEEAHRYIPAQAEQDSAVGGILSRIAKEGRKYGVSLGLVTQRPSDLAEGVLSQCGTIIAMRLNNERDQAMVRSAMPEGGRGLLDTISALRNREAILCGEGVSFPMRASFDNLPEEKRPASSDMTITALWANPSGGNRVLAETVGRWRAAGK